MNRIKTEGAAMETEVKDRSPDTHSVKEVVNAYTIFLKEHHPNHFSRFVWRIKNHPKKSDQDAENAEAIVFSWLNALRLKPQPEESVSSGGPDFRCVPEFNEPFVVEVSSLELEAVEKHTGWSSHPTDLKNKANITTVRL